MLSLTKQKICKQFQPKIILSSVNFQKILPAIVGVTGSWRRHWLLAFYYSRKYANELFYAYN